LLQLLFIFLVSSLDNLLSVEIAQFVHQRGALLAVAFHNGLDEVRKVEAVVLVKLDDHADIDHIYHNFVGAASHDISHLLLLVSA
jgi:hypothetical protein